MSFRKMICQSRSVLASIFSRKSNATFEPIQEIGNALPGGRPNVYVESLVFNDGTSLAVNKDDIVVFVGPNNVGKSQTLRDIQIKARADDPVVMLDVVSFSQDSIFPSEEWLESILSKETLPGGSRRYEEFDFVVYDSELKYPQIKKRPANLTDILIRFLGTEDRLVIANPAKNIDQGKTPRHPIHLLRQKPSLRRKISDEFQKAFGMQMFPFERFGESTPLLLGDCSSLSGSYSDELAREEAFSEQLRKYPHLEHQGDGMRSFAGLMLYLIIEHYNTFLIDEPDSFLHPPQAQVMGETIGNLLSHEQQAFISTHSIHFILGLLEKCPKRVKIVRITRSGDSNTFSVLDNARLLELSRDPFLKHSNLLEGLFYKHVVLCEADADCMFYSMVNGAPDMNGPKGAETLFIHCGGKQRMASVAHDLHDLHIDFRIVPDFDIFNDKITLRHLVEACKGEWSDFDRDYTVLLADIQNRSQNDKSESVLLSEIQNILRAGSSKPVSNRQIKSIQCLFEGESEWDRLKKTGLHGIPSGATQSACRALLGKLKAIGIHVVPCGELERLIPDCGGHGPSWIQNVIETHPELSDPIFAAAKDFVRTWNL